MTPKLKPGAEDLIEAQSFYACKHQQDCHRNAKVCDHWTSPEVDCYEMGFETGAKWALYNLPKLLEATHDFGHWFQGKPGNSVNWSYFGEITRPVAIIEVEK